MIILRDRKLRVFVLALVLLAVVLTVFIRVRQGSGMADGPAIESGSVDDGVVNTFPTDIWDRTPVPEPSSFDDGNGGPDSSGTGNGNPGGTDSDGGNASAFDLAAVPEYEGYPWVVVNSNVPYFTADDFEFARDLISNKEQFEEYPDLDALGRCGAAYALVGIETMPTEERESISSVKPSGWMNHKYDSSIVPGGYVYNRCHLIGFQLTAENANKNNLITGTRYLNIDGMLGFENDVADYVASTGNHALYRVTPVFVDDELVARGVLMEGYSVEDSGEGLVFCVYAYNVQPGILIDYMTGENMLDEIVLEDDVPSSGSAPFDDGDVSDGVASGPADTPPSSSIDDVPVETEPVESPSPVGDASVAEESPSEAEKPATTYGDAGRLYIRDYTARLFDNGSSGKQSVVDDEDSAVWLEIIGTVVIGDHWNQGFDVIKKLSVGDRAYIEYEDGSRLELVLVGTDANGTNDGHYLRDGDGNVVYGMYDYVMYTCHGDWTHVYFAFWEEV